MNDNPHFNKAADSNKEVILERLMECLPSAAHILEIGSGSGQHATHFAQDRPDWIWQTSDIDLSTRGLEQAIKTNKEPNLPAPILLDVANWPKLHSKFDCIYSANCIHAMPGALLPDYIEGASKNLKAGGLMVLYGPFKYAGQYTTDSNRQFDGFLKQTFEGGGIRDFDIVDELAREQGLLFEKDVPMPSNNQFISWRKADGALKKNDA